MEFHSGTAALEHNQYSSYSSHCQSQDSTNLSFSTEHDDDSWWYSDANTPDSKYKEWMLTYGGRWLIESRNRRCRGLFNWSQRNSAGEQGNMANWPGEFVREKCGDDDTEDFHSVHSDYEEPADAITASVPASSSSSRSCCSIQEENYEEESCEVATLTVLEPAMSNLNYLDLDEDYHSSDESLYLVAEPDNELIGASIEKQPDDRNKTKTGPATNIGSTGASPGTFFWRTKEYAALQVANLEKNLKAHPEKDFPPYKTPTEFMASSHDCPPSAKKAPFRPNLSSDENDTSLPNPDLFNEILDNEVQVSLNCRHAVPNSSEQAEAANNIYLSFNVSETQFHPNLQEESQLNLMTKEVALEYMGFNGEEFKGFPVLDAKPTKLCSDYNEKAIKSYSQRQESKQIIDDQMVVAPHVIGLQDPHQFLDGHWDCGKNHTGMDELFKLNDEKVNQLRFCVASPLSHGKTFSSVQVLPKAKRGKKFQKQKAKRFEFMPGPKNEKQTAMDVFLTNKPETDAVQVPKVDEKAGDSGDSTIYSSATFNNTQDLSKLSKLGRESGGSSNENCSSQLENRSKIPVAIANKTPKTELKITAPTSSFAMITNKPSHSMSKSRIPVPVSNYGINSKG